MKKLIVLFIGLITILTSCDCTYGAIEPTIYWLYHDYVYTRPIYVRIERPRRPKIDVYRRYHRTHHRKR